MKLSVECDFVSEEIIVVCEIDISKYLKEKNNFCFALAKSFNIEKILLNDKNLEFNKEDYKMEFLPEMLKYTLTLPKDKEGNLIIKYRGKLSGYYRYFEEKIIHFSFYNGWYPIGFDADTNFDVRIKRYKNYELVKGEFDEREKIWKINYTDPVVDDCNIILLNRDFYKIKESEYLKIYYEEFQRPYVEYIFKNHNLARKYLEDLYGRKTSNKEDMVILPYNEIWEDSAYKRKDLVVITSDKDYVDFESSSSFKGLAHELAHSYAKGANVNSWEDWLNETIAEWSAYLFVLNCEKRDIKEFIEYHRDEVGNKKLILNELGKKRPKEVHSVGTLIFYEIYKNYGVEAIKDLLVAFDRIDVKNTKNYLEYLDNHNNKKLSDEIRKHIIRD